MEKTTQTAGETATESIGLTEMQEDNQPSFYDLAEADGTLMYHQIDSNGNSISAEDY